MTPIEKKAELPAGPYGDINTRNIVLQVMGNTRSYTEPFERRNIIEESLERLMNPEEVLPDSSERARRLIELLEKKGQAFRHTSEYYAAIEDERERVKAYRDLTVVSTVPYGEDAEIVENPCKFLYLPEDATLGQIRDAYIRLSKKWFPDLIYPENREQYERIFGNESSIQGKDLDTWFKEWQSLYPPEIHDVKGFEKLTLEERESYQKGHETYREKEIEYEKVKAEMRRRATIKMQILNKAYAAAKKRFSKQEIESFTGFEWTKETLHALGGMGSFEYEALNLEGEGQLRKNTGKWAINSDVYLAFDFGEKYLADEHNYRQYFTLKPFFAWTELIQAKGLCPTLLDDITKAYKLGDDQAEQLRIMILNHEEPGFILATLNISTKGVEHYKLLHFLDAMYEGPTYTHQVGPREHVSYPLGVEFTPDERLILKYESQESEYDFWEGGDKKEDQFSQLDLQMMRAIAYGPLLQEPKLE